MQTRQQLCGVVDRIGMAMHDLPLAVLPPEDRRAAKHVRRRFGATYRRGRPFDREQICEVLAYVGGNHLPFARTAVREARRELLEHRTDLGPPDRTEGSTEDGDRISEVFSMDCAVSGSFVGEAAGRRRGGRVAA